MKKSAYLFCCLLTILFLTLSTKAAFAQSMHFPISGFRDDDSFNFKLNMNKNSEIAYNSLGQVRIYSMNSGKYIQVTNNYYGSSNVRINDLGKVVWQGPANSSGNMSTSEEVFQYEGLDEQGNPVITRITNNDFDHGVGSIQLGPEINNNGDIVWYQSAYVHLGNGAFEIRYRFFLYRATTRTITDIGQYLTHKPNYPLLISDNGTIAYTSYDEVGKRSLYLFDPAVNTETKLSNNIPYYSSISINKQGKVVWAGKDGTTNTGSTILRIYMYEPGIGTKVISSENRLYNDYPSINDTGSVAWNSSDGVWLFDGSTARLIATGSDWSRAYVYPEITQKGDILFRLGSTSMGIPENLFLYPANASSPNDIQQLTFLSGASAAYYYALNNNGDLVYLVGQNNRDGFGYWKLWGMRMTGVAIPDITPPSTLPSSTGGTYNRVMNITLSCSDGGGSGSGCAHIYYTTDGSTPTTGSQEFRYGIAVTTSTILKFFAVDLAGNQEAVKSETYNITRFEETSAAITYTGTWSGVMSCDPCSYGAKKQSKTVSSSATFTFTGTGVRLIASKNYYQGKANVYIDGVFIDSIDLYKGYPEQFQAIFSFTNLTAGSHTARIEVSGQKNPASYDYYVNIDAFELIP